MASLLLNIQHTVSRGSGDQGFIACIVARDQGFIDHILFHEVLKTPEGTSMFKLMHDHKKRGRGFLERAKEVLVDWTAFDESGNNLRRVLDELSKSPDEHMQEKLQAFDAMFASVKEDFFTGNGDQLREEIFAIVDKSLKRVITKAMETWNSNGIDKFNAEPLASCLLIMRSLKVVEAEPQKFEWHMRALQYCNDWATDAHCKQMFGGSTPAMTPDEMRRIMKFQDTTVIKGLPLAAVLAQAFEIHIRPKVSAALKLQMAGPLEKMGKMVAAFAERADDIMKDVTSFSEPLQAIDTDVVSNLDMVAESLGDTGLEQTLGVVRKWMAIISSSSEVITVQDADSKLNLVKQLFSDIEAFDFILESSLDIPYVMSADSTFQRLLSEAEMMTSQDSPSFSVALAKANIRLSM